MRVTLQLLWRNPVLVVNVEGSRAPPSKTVRRTKARAKRQVPLSQCENVFLESSHGPALEQ